MAQVRRRATSRAKGLEIRRIRGHAGRVWPLDGRAIAEACEARGLPSFRADAAIAGVAVGDRPVLPDDLFVALREDGFDGHGEVEDALRAGAPLALVASDWTGLAALAPELRARCLVTGDTLRAVRLLAARLRRGFAFPVVAVGGSNGKTTTKDMIAAMLGAGGARVTKTPETMNGWSGVPLTLLQRAHARADAPAALVVEIGIDAPGAMAEHASLVDADVAVLTTLAAEHLAGLGSIDGVVREETRLFELSPRAKRIFHVGDERIHEAMASLAAPRAGDVIVAGAARADAVARELANAGVGIVAYDVACASPTSSDARLSWRPPRASAPAWRGVLHVPMAGRHHGEDAAVALAAALSLGRTPDDLVGGFAAFSPPPMRCEARALASGCLLVDDAYNANPSSMRAALELLDSADWRTRPRLAILGDMLDLGAASARLHLELVPKLRALAASGVVVCLYGDEMLVVHRALGDMSAAHLPSEADPRAFAAHAGAALDGGVVLVKGSRGMRLERVVTDLETRGARGVDLSAFAGRFATACVTGTNGKTTTTSLIAAIVAASGEPSCRVTTLGAWVDDERIAVEPTGEAFQRTLARATERGVKTLAVETTSHALAEGFAREWPPTVGVFTNLSRDHLDYHGTPEHYLAAKAQLFLALPPTGAAVLNVADPASALLDEITPPEVRRLGYAARAPDPACAAIPLALAVAPDAITVDEDGTHAPLAPSPFAEALGGRVDLSLVGAVHVENALAAALAAHALGYGWEAIRAGLATFRGVPGRFEIVARRPLVVVDYAHTPDALGRTLAVARSLARGGRLLCVFGCGGDRDPGKRGEMGGLAVSRADVVLLTNDNPRSEDPDIIADGVEEGARKSEGPGRLERILDREAAIGRAVALAAEEDVVVIAGKGHEKTQTIGDREVAFDDVEVARAAVQRRTAR
jgi:UDP-N-acetylmuramoyl-L-alanyl-D-glutamate--2,6-diaminopimelate ligase